MEQTTIIDDIKKHFKGEFLGAVADENDIIIALKTKEVKIENYTSKTIEEIIEEINKNNGR